MPLPIYRLRRWLAVIAVLFTATVSGMYFYARLRQRNVLKEIPNKLGIDIKQTANGYQFSKSDGKRTLFTVQAGSLKQFQLDGSAELRHVSVILYGRDSSRFDQIYGDDFSYDKKSGNITAHGDVQIDLESNPSGGTGPDQGTPRELKNPIHLETTDLIFNQDSGDAVTSARVDFRTPQATGGHPHRYSRQNHARSSRSRTGESPRRACSRNHAIGGSHILSRARQRGAAHPGHRQRERRIQRRRRRPDARPRRSSRDVSDRQTKPAAHSHSDRQCPRRAQRFATHAGRRRTRDPRFPRSQRITESACHRRSPFGATPERRRCAHNEPFRTCFAARLRTPEFRPNRAHRRFLYRGRQPVRPRRNLRGGADHNFPSRELELSCSATFGPTHGSHSRPFRREICRSRRRLKPPDVDPRRA